MGQPSDTETQVELDDDGESIGDDTTVEFAQEMAQSMKPAARPMQPAARSGMQGATLPIVDTLAYDERSVPIAPAPAGLLSLEQYAWLYARQLSGPSELTAALGELSITQAQYADWRTHWESRLMHNPDERSRWFALVAKLRD